MSASSHAPVGPRAGRRTCAWDASAASFRDRHDVTAAPSMRMVVSLADLDESRWINLTGESGHAFDSHNTDQTKLYLVGRTLPWAFTRSAVQATARHTLTLRP